jgi:hypothetical protein
VIAPLWVRRSPTENTVINHLISECARLHVPCERLKGDAGWFDCIVFWPGGKPSLVETKRPKGGRFETMQPRTHEKYRRLKYDVHVLRTKDAVDKFIAQWEPKCRHSMRALIPIDVPKSRIPSGNEMREMKRAHWRR